MAEETPADEDIEFPAISPAPVLIAFLNLVQALVIWVVAVARPLAALRPVQQAAAHRYRCQRTHGGNEKMVSGESWFEGFVLELQTPSNTFKAYKCNSTEPHIIRNDYVDGKFSFLLATDPPVNNRRKERKCAARCASKLCLITPTDGRLFVGAEAPQRPKLNIATKALVKGAMAFISRSDAMASSGVKWRREGEMRLPLRDRR